MIEALRAERDEEEPQILKDIHLAYSLRKKMTNANSFKEELFSHFELV